uniref:SUEL-type lectin domain-containing protein n=1 Tax=Sinocyclocheilus grahami TaxID=75366 RepID=A0A672RD84_SINGR
YVSVAYSVVSLLISIHCIILFMSLSLNRCNGLRECELNTQGLIQINTANYGRTDKTTCSEGRPSEQLQNTNCYSPNALAPVSKRCNGLRECELNTQGLAPKDPCFGTYKYYTTNYICIPAETSVTCHGGYSYLKCENGKIQINTANYGRTDKTTCSEGRPSEQLQNTNCYSPNALAPVCEGKNSCSILASNSVFSDPCVGTFKYLYISYSCVSKCKCDCTEQ